MTRDAGTSTAVPVRQEDRFLAARRAGSKQHVVSGRHVYEGMRITVRCGRKIRVTTYEQQSSEAVPAHVCADCLEFVRVEP